MKRIFKHLFMLCLFGMISIGAKAAEIPNNEIWYEASAQLEHVTDDGYGLHTNAFNAKIRLHTFSAGKGKIIFDADVTSIGFRAFYYCSGLKSMTIPNSVKSIVNYAICGCSGLESVTLGNSVTSIGRYAFSGCNNVKELIYAEGTKTILSTGLKSITSVTIPNSVTEIGDKQFYDYTSLKSVTIPNSVTSIGNQAFLECTGLTSVTIGSSVTSIADNAFSGCSNVKELIYADGTKKVLKTGLKSITTVTIPLSVNEIGDYAFLDCKSLENVIIPSSDLSVTIPRLVTKIGSNAFSCCYALTRVVIPNSVTEIGSGAFYHCWGLTSIVVESDNKVYDSRDKCNAIIEKASNRLITGCKYTTIPNSVTSIERNAFSCCYGLTSVTIPNSVTEIGYDAFCGCTDLSSVTFKSLPALSYSVFDLCDNLSSIVLDLNDSDKPYIGTSLANYPNNGKFTEVHYNRTLAADTWGTMVLPFVPDESSLAKVKLYALSDASSDAVRFKEVEADAVQAGVPYLFKNVSGQDDFTLTTNNTTISTNLVEQTPVNGMMLQGVYQQQKFTGDGTVYGISGNKFLTTTGTMTINPFHAYLKSVASGAKEILIDDEIDGIEDIKNFTPALSQGEGVNLQGIHVGKGYNGIVIINGKKYLNK